MVHVSCVFHDCFMPVSCCARHFSRAGHDKTTYMQMTKQKKNVASKTHTDTYTHIQKKGWMRNLTLDSRIKQVVVSGQTTSAGGTTGDFRRYSAWKKLCTSFSRWFIPWESYYSYLQLVAGLEHFFIFPYIGKNHPNWLSYFSEGWPWPTNQIIYRGVPQPWGVPPNGWLISWNIPN